jgi:uncharacterized protein (DUF362 family)
VVILLNSLLHEKPNRHFKNSFMRMNRRRFLKYASGLLFASLPGFNLFYGCDGKQQTAEAFIGKVAGYDENIAAVISAGFRELNVTENEIRGKRVLLKPNLVEPHRGMGHITTHPLLLRGAIEAFMGFGAHEVLVAEGPGHCRDSFRVLEESGLTDILREDRIRFMDLNYQSWFTVPNAGHATRLKSLTFPTILKEVDWIVSVPKMKTHHWAGVTLSMKNLFGVMPGMFYGWPKNVFHAAGIESAILDINATLKPHFAIVDGIVGMEGDGPIMGTPKTAGVLVMGKNLPAVDATSCRIMGINPRKVRYLADATGLGPIQEPIILQRGETIKSVHTSFSLLDKIEAHRRLMVESS